MGRCCADRNVFGEPAIYEMLCLLYAQVPGTISPGPFQQFNCIINTVVSLLGATVVTFIASAFVGEKFDMVRHAPLILSTCVLEFQSSANVLFSLHVLL